MEWVQDARRIARRLAIKEYRKYLHIRLEDINDIEQDIMVDLVRAVENYSGTDSTYLTVYLYRSALTAVKHTRRYYWPGGAKRYYDLFQVEGKRKRTKNKTDRVMKSRVLKAEVGVLDLIPASLDIKRGYLESLPDYRTPELNVSKREFWHNVYEKLVAVNYKWAELIILLYLYDLTRAKIATVIGVSASTVTDYEKKALAYLRDKGIVCPTDL